MEQAHIFFTAGPYAGRSMTAEDFPVDTVVQLYTPGLSVSHLPTYIDETMTALAVSGNEIIDLTRTTVQAESAVDEGCGVLALQPGDFNSIEEFQEHLDNYAEEIA